MLLTCWSSRSCGSLACSAAQFYRSEILDPLTKLLNLAVDRQEGIYSGIQIPEGGGDLLL
jgi:hypothetical protein